MAPDKIVFTRCVAGEAARRSNDRKTVTRVFLHGFARGRLSD
jgi:hypothetical protein